MSEQAAQPEKPISPAQALYDGRELLNHFDVSIDPVTRTEEFEKAMDQLNPRFQGERNLVRFELEQDQTEWPEKVRSTIMQSATRMRMVEPAEVEVPIETPLTGDYDVIISLGAARQANPDRLRYAAKAIRDGRATTRKLVIVGSARKLKEAEQENTANYAPGAATEFDLCEGAARTIAKEFPELDIEAMFVDDEKADTARVVEHVLATLLAGGALPEGASIGAVTTQIYQTATSFDVARAAEKFGVARTFVGGNPSNPKIVAKRTPATYLSEVLRTLKAAAQALPRDEERGSDVDARMRAQEIQSELRDISRRDTELRAELKEIDLQNPQLAERIENLDGTVTVREVSGKEWTEIGSDGRHYFGPDDLSGYYPE
jgi:hypothetical protein